MTNTNAEMVALVDANITTNGNRENTGARVNAVWQAQLAREAQPNGVATLDGEGNVVDATNAAHYGATGDGVTDDGAVLNEWLAGLSLLLPDGTFLTSQELSSSALQELKGRGWTIAFGQVLSGSKIAAASSAVEDLLTLSGSVTKKNIAALALEHRGSGSALTVSNVIKCLVEDTILDCVNEGETGLTVSGNSYFFVASRLTVKRFNGKGGIVGGTGSQHIFRDCHFNGNDALAGDPTVGLEIQRFDFLIDGGQYNVDRSDDAGVGILVNNVDAVAAYYGGRIANTICEAGIAVKITGDSKAFNAVVVERPYWNLGIVAKGVEFGRTNRSILFMPIVETPTGGGTLAEFTALSGFCGIICDDFAARAPLTVSGSATSPWKQVIGVVTLANRALITTYANLTTICDHVVGLGRCVHNGTAWDKTQASVADDAVAQITPPAASGIVEVRVAGGGYARASYTSTSMSQIDVDGSGEVIATNGSLAAAGTDGKLVIGMNSGIVEVRNRLGGTKTATVEFR